MTFRPTVLKAAPAMRLRWPGHLLLPGIFDRVIAVMRQRLAAGEQVIYTYQEPGLAWLERQAEVAEDLVAQRQAAARHD